MKINVLILLLIIFSNFGCITSSKTTSKQQKEVSIEIKAKDNITWGKDFYLNIEGTIKNNTDSAIVMTKTIDSYKFIPNMYKVVTSLNQNLILCDIDESDEDNYANKTDFWVIAPNSSKDFYINGRFYYLLNCGKGNNEVDSVDLKIVFNGRPFNLNNESFLIKNGYKFKSKEEKDEIIHLLNDLYPKRIESNSINIKFKK